MNKSFAPSSPLQPQNSTLDTKISPSILLIIIILAIIFFISGLLHLVIRCLLKATQRNYPDEINNVTVLQGQLRQLFHLHDSGVDQSYIDTLPVFHYKEIIGNVKDPFDCAVCLCEFEQNDKLRLLPKCSHAFHVDCIDTWLLSHSTCPLCRSSLLFQSGRFCKNPTPFVCVLESGESSRENPEMIPGLDEENKNLDGEEKIMVKLGKFKNFDQGEGSYNNNDQDVNEDGKLNSRRCFSMGSFAYILDEGNSLKVPITKTLVKKRSIIRNVQRESFSVSKIWQRDHREKKGNEFISSKRVISEIEIEDGGERDDEEIQSCYSVDSIANQSMNSTSHRRTLLWLMGRHNNNNNINNKVVHNHSSSFSSIV